MNKDLNYYLFRGCSEEMAAYFLAGRKTITDVVPDEKHTLLLTFSNGEIRSLDIQKSFELTGKLSCLLDPSVFNRVYLDECGAVSWDIDPDLDSNIVWNNKIDLDPDTCYVKSAPIER